MKTCYTLICRVQLISQLAGIKTYLLSGESYLVRKLVFRSQNPGFRIL